MFTIIGVINNSETIFFIDEADMFRFLDEYEGIETFRSIKISGKIFGELEEC